MSTILFLLDLRKKKTLCIIPFSLLAITFYQVETVAHVSWLFSALSESKQDASQAFGALWCVNTVLKVNLTHLQCTTCLPLNKSFQAVAVFTLIGTYRNYVYVLDIVTTFKKKPGTLSTSPVLQLMLLVLVPFVFVYLQKVSLYHVLKRCLFCPWRLRTMRNKRSLFLSSSDLLGIQFSDTSQRLAFFPHTCLCMHALKLLHMHT